MQSDPSQTTAMPALITTTTTTTSTTTTITQDYQEINTERILMPRTHDKLNNI